MIYWMLIVMICVKDDCRFSWDTGLTEENCPGALREQREDLAKSMDVSVDRVYGMCLPENLVNPRTRA